MLLFLSLTQSCPTLQPPWTATHQASLSFTISRSLLKLTSVESVMPSNHLILRHPLLLLPSVFPNIMVFSNELALCIRWPGYRSFSFSISPSNKYSGLISFRIDWFDFLAVQGTLTSLLQHPHALEQLSLCATNTSLCCRAQEPQLLKPSRPGAQVLQQEKPPHQAAPTPQLKSSLCLLQLRGSQSRTKTLHIQK